MNVSVCLRVYMVFICLLFSFPALSNEMFKKEADCIAMGGTWDKLSNNYCIRIEEEKCAERGGRWQRVCMDQSLFCVMPYKDADKVCTDGSQCSGRTCQHVGNKPNDIGVISGRCIASNYPCGPSVVIESGAVVAGSIE